MAGLRKRSLTIAGHSTSVSLEDEFWRALKNLSVAQGLSINALIERIDQDRTGNLSSAVRVYVLRQALEVQATSTDQDFSANS